MGGVNFLTQAEVAREVKGQTDLGYLSFDDTGTPQGGAQYGVKVFRESMTRTRAASAAAARSAV